MSQRLTREDIKRDEVMEGLSRVAGFIGDHGKKLATGLAVVLAIMAGYAVWQSVEARRQVKANEELASALATAAPGGDVGQAKAELERVAESYGSTPAGSIAYAYLGTIAARAGDSATARSRWNDFLARHDDDALAASVERNLISLDRSEGKSVELADRLRAMLANRDSALAEDVLLFELGRTLEDLGEVESAREIYARLIEEHPTSAFAGEARERSSALALS